MSKCGAGRASSAATMRASAATCSARESCTMALEPSTALRGGTRVFRSHTAFIVTGRVALGQITDA